MRGQVRRGRAGPGGGLVPGARRSPGRRRRSASPDAGGGGAAEGGRGRQLAKDRGRNPWRLRGPRAGSLRGRGPPRLPETRLAPSSALAPPPFRRNSVSIGCYRLGAGPRAAAGRDGGCFCSFGGTQRTRLPSGSRLPGGPRGVRRIACPDRVSRPVSRSRPPAPRSPRHFPGPSAGGPGPRPLAGSAPGGGWAAGAPGKGKSLLCPSCASRSRTSLSRLLPPGAGLPPRGRPRAAGETELPDPAPQAVRRDVSANGHLRLPRPRGWGWGGCLLAGAPGSALSSLCGGDRAVGPPGRSSHCPGGLGRPLSAAGRSSVQLTTLAVPPRTGS